MTLIVFGHVVDFGFLNWDDNRYIVANPALHPPTLASLASIWRMPDPALYIPVPYTVWWLIAKVSPANTGSPSQFSPVGFHLANLVVHCTAVVLCFGLVRRLGARTFSAALGAAFFAVHPLVVESVAWSMALRDTLAATLCLATLLWVQRERLTLAYIATGLAILCKPAAVMVVPMAICIDLLVYRYSIDQSVRRHRWMVLVAVLGTVMALLYQYKTNAILTELWQRPLVATDAVAFYLAKIAWPVHLTFDYSRNPAAIFSDHQAYWTWLLPAAITATVLWLRRPAVTLVTLLFILPLIPALGIIEFGFEAYSTVADRFAYLSMPALAIGVAWLLDGWASRAAFSIVISAICVMATLSIRQANVWRDDARFFSHGVEINPSSAASWNGLALVAARNGDLQLAFENAQRATRLFPDFVAAHRMLLDIYIIWHHAGGAAYELAEAERASALGTGFNPKADAFYHRTIDRMGDRVSLPTTGPAGQTP